jgi:hypothetical protein
VEKEEDRQSINSPRQPAPGFDPGAKCPQGCWFREIVLISDLPEKGCPSAISWRVTTGREGFSSENSEGSSEAGEK